MNKENLFFALYLLVGAIVFTFIVWGLKLCQ